MFEKVGYYRTRSRRASGVRNRTLKEVIAGKQPDLDPYFSDDTLFIDLPAPLLYKEAYQRFGDRARFILSMRSSPDKWVESLKTHSLSFQPKQDKHQIIYGLNIRMDVGKNILTSMRSTTKRREIFLQGLTICFVKSVLKTLLLFKA